MTLRFHNIFATLNTWLRTRDILIAGKILAELDYAEKSPKPYTKQELKDLFAGNERSRETSTGKSARCTCSRTVAQVPAQAQEREEILQGQILHSIQEKYFRSLNHQASFL